MAEAHSPLEQFKINPLVDLQLGGVDISFTNSAAMMVASIVLVTLFLTLGSRGRALVPGRWQSLAELVYEFVANMLRDNVGSEGRKYFPFVFSLFMFVLFANSLGLVPYSFTTTSHIIVTFALALFVVGLCTLIGILKHGLHFFSFFVPKGVPFWMMPLVVPIEVISYISRPVSLSVRLFANMVAGHTMLKVLAGFVVMLGAAGIAPLAVVVGLTALEIFIALLQAYVFTVLTCIYLNDALHLH